MGNLEDARVVLDTLAQAIEDAVYLDEDAYNQLLPTMQYTRVIHVCCTRHQAQEPSTNPAHRHSNDA